MINKVILIGNLGQDPELQKTNSGMSVVKISIATARRGKNNSNETDWHSVTCFGTTAENVSKYLSKGRRVYVEGRLQYSQWTDEKTGQKRKRAEVIADNVTFLGSDNSSGGGGGTRSTNNSDFGNYDSPTDYDNGAGDEDIPF